MMVNSNVPRYSNLASELHRKYLFKVAYYSFQKRKTTFLELKFKANRSFSFGSFVAITVKRNNINPHYPGKVI